MNIAAQTLLFLKSILLGACLMLLYDFFRILRIAVRTPAVVVAVQDLLYFAVCAVASFLFLVSANYGEVRFFALLGEGIGALLCAMTLSRLIMTCSRAIIAFVRGLLRLVWKVFLRPIYLIIRWFARQIVRILEFFTGVTKKTCRKANYSLKRRRVLLYNLIISGQKERQKSKKEKAVKKGVKKHENEKPESEAAYFRQ